MKPTFQIKRPSRHVESQRPQGQHVIKSPATDWSYQSAADLRGGTAALHPEDRPLRPSFFTLTEGFFATSNRESRFEGALFGVIAALAAWPIALAVHMASNTVR